MIAVDTNVLIYHLTGNHPEFSPRSSALIERIMVGEEEAFVSVVAITETLYVLRSQYQVPASETATHMLALCYSEHIQSEIKEALLWALGNTASQSKLSFEDSYQLALADILGLGKIYSFDKAMDRYPGIERIEPE